MFEDFKDMEIVEIPAFVEEIATEEQLKTIKEWISE